MNRIISKIKVLLVWRKNKFAPVSYPRRGKVRIDDKIPRRRKSSIKKIAVSAAPAVILVLLPIHAAALDSFIAPPPVSPERIAVVMACAGGFTLMMLIRHRKE